MCAPISSEPTRLPDISSPGSSFDTAAGQESLWALPAWGQALGKGRREAWLCSRPYQACVCARIRGCVVSSYKPPIHACFRHIWNGPTVWDTNQSIGQGTLRRSQ